MDLSGWWCRQTYIITIQCDGMVIDRDRGAQSPGLDQEEEALNGFLKELLSELRLKGHIRIFQKWGREVESIFPPEKMR